MTNLDRADEPTGAAQETSLTRRLEQHFGPDIDPRVELPHEPLSSPSASGTSNTRVIERLAARGPLATRYRLDGEIARGGMGAILEVFDKDLRRKLAMKVVLDESSASPKPAPNATRLARFLEEAQITGQLDHPGIVPVHELGIDAQGQAYFTMRLVRGRDLSAIFRLVDTGAEGWTLPRALGVLLKVCEAMAFAHSKGVVHRDLKPANVMVGEFGEVYVMDWGLARVRGAPDRHDLRARPVEAHPVATDRRESSSSLPSDALLTMDGDVLGTPSYMPPEQARGRLDSIDERSDIYAVGAMLYRLLAHRAPYSEPNEEPEVLEVLTRILAGPPPGLEGLNANTPPELIAICEKAMARERKARYSDMLLLAADLRAFLEGRVVSAFEAGTWAQARKWVQRNRALSFAAAAGVLALVGGLSASLWLGQRSAKNARLAEERRVIAEENAASASRQARVSEEVNAFLNRDLLAAVAPEHEGAEVTVREVLDKAALRLDGRFRSEPQVEAALRETIGTSYAKLGAFDTALVHLERALELRRADAATPAESRLNAMRWVAWAYRGLGRLQESIDLYETVLEELESSATPAIDGLLSSNNDLALTLIDAGRLDEARACLELAVQLGKQHLGEDSPLTLVAISNLARHDSDTARLEEAIASFKDVLPRQRRVIGERHPDTLATLVNLGVALNVAGRFEEAERVSRESFELCREVFGPDHPSTGEAAGNLGVALFSQRRMAEAEQQFLEAERINARIRSDDHPELLQARSNLAGARLELGRVAEGLELAAQVLAAQRRVLGDTHPQTLISFNRVASAYKALWRLDDAERAFREALPLTRAKLGDDHPSTIVVVENLGGVLYAKKDYEGAEALTRQALEARRRVLGPEHPDVLKSSFNLGMVLRGKGDKDAARELFEYALGRDGERPLELNPTAPGALEQLGQLELDARNGAAAADYYEEALALRRKLGPDDDNVAFVLHQLGVAHFLADRMDDSIAALREALELRDGQLGRTDTRTRTTLIVLARMLIRVKQFEEAERLSLDLYEQAEQAIETGPDRMKQPRQALVELYEAWGRHEEAARWR